MISMTKTIRSLFAGAALCCLAAVQSQAATQTLTIFGGLGNQGDVDQYTEASRDGGLTWQPAYLTGWHPWGFIAGTNSWINFDPSPFVGLYSTTLYRVRFSAPATWSNPQLLVQLRADNYAEASLNGTSIGTNLGELGPSADISTAQSMVPGENIILLSVQDWGGWVGFNYRIDISVESDQPLTVKPSPFATVVDTTAPVISQVSPSTATLWSPNHKMVPVVISVSATDDSGAAPTIRISSVTSNEPDNGLGDGDKPNDIQFSGLPGDMTVNLRSERSGKGNGRIYTITVEASDAAGNKSYATTTVSVPKSKEDDDEGEKRKDESEKSRKKKES
jgi:hypothetical protein